VTGM